ncbi:MAG: class I SAM-dependent methyltransferase, partial [Gammaproteobacteria bacterium]|nr:class I SAM-dependent methyltransferase [Gammaproteobacteria bacterium]
MNANLKHPGQDYLGRVHYYATYRPPYHPNLMDGLVDAIGLRPDHVIADIGCGTGLLSEPFLKNGNRVYGIEPNREMLRTAEARLGDYPGFIGIDARAEATTLPDASVDVVAAGQAFHWFEQPQARQEFLRILAPGGHI